MRILVVEDDRLIRDFVVEALREEGYQVIDAACGEEALAWCRRGLADVLVTNIRLPRRIDGWQIAERCREHDPYLPVIYASGFSPVAARPVPASLSLQKTYHPEDVVKAVQKMSRGRRASPNSPDDLACLWTELPDIARPQPERGDFPRRQLFGNQRSAPSFGYRVQNKRDSTILRRADDLDLRLSFVGQHAHEAHFIRVRFRPPTRHV